MPGLPPKLAGYLPFTDLARCTPRALRQDALAALTVIFMAVPQGIAYAMIAGLPPAMGLYAAAIPTIVGALFRSSRHVITGPTNALSLLVGGALALRLDADPVVTAVTLALMVGLMQVAAGVLGLGALVDFISAPVVLGYITGAAVLIGVGQLDNLTETVVARGHLLSRLGSWAQGLGEANHTSMALGLGTAALIVALRRVDRRLPGAIIAMAVATLLSWALDLPAHGVSRVLDVHPVPVGLPPISLPDLDLMQALLPVAVAATVLSLVEANAVARAIAAHTGQRLRSGAEFAGQGLANLAAAFFSGYPVSGSLSRSALNHRAGAATRLAGVMSGAAMLAVLLVLGPLVNETPIASLAGLLLVVAWDLVDRAQILQTLKAGPSDRLTFLVTLLGTWALPLDQAIYLGVGLSLVFLLRQVRLLGVRELEVDMKGGLHEVGPLADTEEDLHRHTSAVRVLQLEGRLFFGVEGALRDLLDGVVRDQQVRAVILRLKRAQGMDVTVARAILEHAHQLRSEGRHMLLAGVPVATLHLLERLGVVDALGREQVFVEHPNWANSLGAAYRRALELVGGDPAVWEAGDLIAVRERRKQA
ncbi:MAG: SulP family inorganic anion transporter [Myxococcales bacterium]|nr:SulP family inorganic anion transporter [Myxococcales bacterium]MCB9646903.1 SulP family inorganic anion transporter [Deltaproteobacteria bacterium]